MNRKTINLNDPFRALLTDTLPYETPFIFSNVYLHARFRKGIESIPAHIRTALFLTNKTNYTRPFVYEIERPYATPRKLTVPHPAAQVRFCRFYQMYGDILVYLSTKSPFSIRYPSAVARSFFERKGLSVQSTRVEGDEVEVEPPPFIAESDVASSYFRYRDFNIQYKFFESRAFLDLEARFNYLGTVDVKKCFYNIYTHTLPWAVKGKSFAKSNRSKGAVENEFDSLMQFSNFGETNGIPVGPEISRVFAEIIFQDLDVAIERKLGRQRLNRGSDYEIRRYVDDYFIFVNEQQDLDRIKCAIEEVLEGNRLYLNEVKTDIIERPFITQLSCAKRDTSRSIAKFIAKLTSLYEGNAPGTVKSEQRRFIDDLRSVAVKDNVPIEPLAKFAISSISFAIHPLILAIKKDSDSHVSGEWYIRIAHAVIDTVGFLYSIAPNFRSSVLISRLFLRFYYDARCFPEDVSDDVKLILSQWLHRLLLKASRHGRPGIADLNLLIVYSKVGKFNRLDPEFLMRWWGLKKDGKMYEPTSRLSGLNYFQICTLIFYIRSDLAYRDLLNEVMSLVLDQLDVEAQENSIHLDAELVMLCLDLASCPWLETTIKDQIVKYLIRSIESKGITEQKLNERANQILAFCGTRCWFFDWAGADHLGHLLKKKELIPAYS